MGVEDAVCLEFQHSNLDRVQRVRVRRGWKKVLLQCQPLVVVDEAARTPEEPLDETSVLRTVEPGLFVPKKMRRKRWRVRPYAKDPSNGCGFP